jgi:hypothetical protein
MFLIEETMCPMGIYRGKIYRRIVRTPKPIRVFDELWLEGMPRKAWVSSPPKLE